MRTTASRRPRRGAVRSALALSLMVGGFVVMTLPTGAAPGDDPVTGVAYRDADADGRHDPSEAGEPNITVTATDTAGAVISTTTGPTGAYSLAVAALGPGPYRIEFSGWPTHLRSAPHGDDNATSVTIAQAGATVDFGVLDPDDYCQADPRLAVSCFVSGAPGGGPLSTAVSFPFSAGTIETSAHNTAAPGPAGYDTPEETSLTTLGQTGSVYGQGWHRGSNSLYLAAYAKKYVPFGPSGSGAIYVRHAGSAPRLLWTTGSPITRSVASGNWYEDPWTDEIGKVGWGDIDVVGNRLYAVNLETRRLFVFELDAKTGDMIGNGPVAALPIPAVAADPGDSRPFGLGSRDGIVYVGGVDSAQRSGGTPTAWVIAFDPATAAFSPTPVAQFGLGYPRGCSYVAKSALSPSRCAAVDGSADWRRWGAAPHSADTPELAAGRVVRTQTNPQPMLSDIAFSDDGSMSLGFRDRFGDQAGRFIPGGSIANPLSPTGSTPLYLTGYAFGDTLRLARSAPTSWALESNGTSGATTGTADSGMGPGGGEFYDADNSLYPVVEAGVPTLQGHDEVTMGALFHLPGTSNMTTTAYDVFGRWDTLGVRFMTDTGADAPRGGDSTDLNVRAYSLYRGTLGGTSPFGKVNGLGDLEAMCDEAPIELGNYVWYDADRDGVQDPTERPLPGVVVTLHNSAGRALATATTDDSGRYWFASADAANLPTHPGREYGIVAGGIRPDTDYSLTFDASNANTAGIGIDATELRPTTPGKGSATTGSKPTSSDGSPPRVAVHTGTAGTNDHTLDAGYVRRDTASIALRKSVNGDDANVAPGPTLNVGSLATFTYLVTNTGATTLNAVTLGDDRIGAISCPRATLSPGESMTCVATQPVIDGAYENTAVVVGQPTDGSARVTAVDTAHYVGLTARVLETTTVVAPTTSALLQRPTTTVPTSVRDRTGSGGPTAGSGPLARTGNNSSPTMLLGTALVIAGAAMWLTSRRRSTD